MGADSTIKALQNTDLRQYQILHFSTHSIFDNDYPERSGIVLSAASGPPDKAGRFDYFSLKDVYNLPAPLDLVVLSACSTGLGKNVRGEGLIGMTRGFMYAGAASVMSSLWEVDDEATAELMRHAYDAMLREGKTPAAALRAAQNTIRRQAGWQSPYYWAAFTLQGQYRRAITPAPPSSFPTTLTLAVLAALFATLGIFYLIRYRFKANKGLN
jgi:CHAT domain-containing protein